MCLGGGFFNQQRVWEVEYFCNHVMSSLVCMEIPLGAYSVSGICLSAMDEIVNMTAISCPYSVCVFL